VRRALVLATLVLSLSACSDGGDDTPDRDPAPSSDGVISYSDLSQKHLGKGEYDITYPQSPPVGGAHSPVWLKCQTYTSELPKVNAVHSLEHGAVWITYLPDTKPADVTVLDEYVGLNREYVLVSPYAGQDSPIVVTAWGKQLKVTSPTDPRIQQFVTGYAGKGPEKKVTCASSGASLEQALQYDASQQ
jgi:hypothetical protein